MIQGQSQYSELLRNAYAEILRLKEKQHAGVSEPIAIIGAGCRFPGGAANLEKYWDLLVEGIDAIKSVPEDRWDRSAYYSPDPSSPGTMYTVAGGFLREEVDKFDADFFRVPSQEARYMDPQHRLLLEVTWEALENAFQPVTALSGKNVGVFIGACNVDYQAISLMSGGAKGINTYSGIGTALSSSAGRISHFLQTHGPSLTVDTACSSSLVALHLACQSLLQQESVIAIAGGVNLMLSPFATIAFSKSRMLSPSGRCQTFDAGADGYVRGEGCGVVVLKRLRDAIDSGDPVRGVIRATAVNHDGGAAGLTVPNAAAQRAVIAKAFAHSGRNIEDVGYFEAHGTGTPLGDPIEIRALASCFASTDQTNSPYIGSVKTNIGHLEGAAGIAGVIKVMLALEKKAIPRHLHFSKLNPYIAECRFPFRIPRQLEPWPEGKRHLAGVSSFGFNGTNAHVVLEAAPETVNREAAAVHREEIMVLSARNRRDLRRLSDLYICWFQSNPSASLTDVCYALAVGRTAMESRLAIVARTISDAQRQLEAFVEGIDLKDVYISDTETPRRRGDVKPNMARDAAKAFVCGNTIDWRDWFSGPNHWVTLPSYPFARESYWVLHQSCNRGTTADPGLSTSPWTERPSEETGAFAGSGIVTVILSTPVEDRGTLIRNYLGTRLTSLVGGPTMTLSQDSTFSELGVDSLMASNLLDDIRSDLGILLYPRELFENSTLPKLGSYIESRFIQKYLGFATDSVSNRPTLSVEPSRQSMLDKTRMPDAVTSEELLPALQKPVSRCDVRRAVGQSEQPSTNLGAIQHPKEVYVDIRGRKICLCDWGDQDKPVAFCIHGLFDQALIWSEVAVPLAQHGYRVLAPDLAGHGKSDHLHVASSYELVEFLADLDQIVAHLDCGPPLIIGHSMGAALAAIFAALWPARVGGLVLLELPGSLLDPDRNISRSSLQEDVAKELKQQVASLTMPTRHTPIQSLEEAAARLRRVHPSLTDELSSLLAARVLKPDGTRFHWSWDPALRVRAGLQLPIGEYHELLRSIQGQAALLYGKASNFLTADEIALHKILLPGALHLSVPSGHHIPFDAAAPVVDTILRLQSEGRLR